MVSFPGYLNLLRIERAFSAMVGVVITGIVVRDFVDFHWDYVIACLVVFFSALANFALNDIQDINIDRLNRRNDRPLATGSIRKEAAYKVVFLSATLAYVLSLFLNTYPRLLLIIGLPISLFYNIYLKRYLVFKNLFTSLANVGVIFMGALVLDTIIEPLAYFLAFISFFFSFFFIKSKFHLIKTY